MATEQGMFGPNPLDLQDQLRLQAQKENSSLDLGSLSGRAGVMLGEGINQLLGREDPRVTQAKQMEEVKNELRQEGIGAGDPDEFFPALIKKLNSKGLVEQAMQVAQTYESQKLARAKTGSEISKNNAAAYASMREKLSPVGKLQAEYADAVARGDTKKAKELQDAINLANQGNLEKTTEGVPGKDGYVREVLRTRDGTLIHEGEPFKKTPLVDQSTKGDSDMYSGSGKKAMDEWNTKQAGFRQASVAFKELEGLVNKPMVNGTLAMERTEALRIARTLGITTEEANSKLDNNDLLSSLTMRIVLPRMKELGGSDSNEELRKIEAMGPNAKISPEAMKNLIRLFYKDVNSHAQVANKAQENIKKGMSESKAWATAYMEVGVDMSSPLAKEAIGGVVTPSAPAAPAPATQPKKPVAASPGVDIEAEKAKYKAHLAKIAEKKGWTPAQLNAVIKQNLGE